MEFLPYSSFTQTFFTHYDFLHTHWINDSQSEIFKCVHVHGFKLRHPQYSRKSKAHREVKITKCLLSCALAPPISVC